MFVDDAPLPFISRRAIRRDRLQFTINGQVSVCITPSTGAVTIQERGFRTKRTGSGGLGGHTGGSKVDREKNK
ncbi:unnamed protein product [Strongylus vulgaris]|uniref:Uncharacterized protein n=1 Tax=Strongylus vulgaris TaxID=40348 RepID=A0A3P7LNX4_STRVU|nr:unnamed protein product [Strongylus vulgaris]